MGTILGVLKATESLQTADQNYLNIKWHPVVLVTLCRIIFMQPEAQATCVWVTMDLLNSCTHTDKQDEDYGSSVVLPVVV